MFCKAYKSLLLKNFKKANGSHFKRSYCRTIQYIVYFTVGKIFLLGIQMAEALFCFVANLKLSAADVSQNGKNSIAVKVVVVQSFLW